MTYPIRSVPDGDTAWGGDMRAVIAGVNDHQTRLTAIENLPNVKGDLLVAPTDNTWNRLAVGTNGQVLTADSTATVGVAWATPAASSGTFATFAPTVSETWTGTNGAAWPSRWTTTGTTADIQSNQGRHLLPATVSAVIRSVLSGTVADGGLLLRWQFDSTGVFRILDLEFRRTDAANLYTVSIQHNVISLALEVAGVYTTLATDTTFTQAANTFLWTRVNFVGSRLQVRWWVDGTTEPDNWNFDVTDTTWTSGAISLKSTNGTTAVSRTVLFDDLRVWDVGSSGSGGGSSTVIPNAQSASYTLVLSDAGKAVEITNASANTLTVPTNASVAFPIGTVIEIAQMGAGQTTIAGSGVTLRSASGLKLRTQYSVASVRKNATDTWVVSGDVVV